jgi:hypothetical protein
MIATPAQYRYVLVAALMPAHVSCRETRRPGGRVIGLPSAITGTAGTTILVVHDGTTCRRLRATTIAWTFWTIRQVFLCSWAPNHPSTQLSINQHFPAPSFSNAVSSYLSGAKERLSHVVFGSSDCSSSFAGSSSPSPTFHRHPKSL